MRRTQANLRDEDFVRYERSSTSSPSSSASSKHGLSDGELLGAPPGTMRIATLLRRGDTKAAIHEFSLIANDQTSTSLLDSRAVRLWVDALSNTGFLSDKEHQKIKTQKEGNGRAGSSDSEQHYRLVDVIERDDIGRALDNGNLPEDDVRMTIFISTQSVYD